MYYLVLFIIQQIMDLFHKHTVMIKIHWIFLSCAVYKYNLCVLLKLKSSASWKWSIRIKKMIKLLLWLKMICLLVNIMILANYHNIFYNKFIGSLKIIKNLKIKLLLWNNSKINNLHSKLSIILFNCIKRHSIKLNETIIYQI